MERRLAAIMATDVVGYSRLIRADEEGTLAALKALRADLIDPKIAEHHGRIVKLMGDGMLVEFASVVDAVHAAVETQQAVIDHNSDVPADKRIELRIGINLGDVVIDGDDIQGDGINVAARLEGMAEPGGICVSGMVYEGVRDRIDVPFEDLGEQEVKNIDRPVRVWRWVADGSAAVVSRQAVEPLPLPDKPSIAVLPFTNMSGDPEQEYFSDGITEDLITDLSKISGLSVVSRNAVFLYRGKAVNPVEVSEELGVRYVLEGSIRKAANRVRISAQLIDPTTGYHLWAERYDRDLTDIFALQDEITEKIVVALDVKLTAGEQGQVVARYTDNLEAYDYFLRGRADQARVTKETTAQAREMFERAVELDPSFAGAYAILSHTHFRDWRNQWSEDTQALERAFEAAKKAVALDDSLPLARTYLAWVYVYRKQYEEAIAEGKRAISLDPNFAEGYARLGQILIFAGRPQEGIDLVKKAMRLGHHYAFTYLFYLAHGYYAMEKYEDAIAALKRCITRNPGMMGSNLMLAVIHGELGRKEEVQSEVAETLRISPRASMEGQRERMPFKDQEVLERYLEGLRQAGLPEKSRSPQALERD